MVEAKIESYLKRCYYDYDNAEWLYVKNDGSFIASIPDWLVPVLKLYIDNKKVYSVITPGNHRWSFPIQYSEQPISPLADLRIPVFELTRSVINLYRLKHDAKEWKPPLSRLKDWDVLQSCICLQSHNEWRYWNARPSIDNPDGQYYKNRSEYKEFADKKGWNDVSNQEYEPEIEDLDDDYWIEKSYTVHDRYKALVDRDKDQDAFYYDPVFSAFRSKEIKKMGIKEVDHDLYKKVPKIPKLSRKAKTEIC